MKDRIPRHCYHKRHDDPNHSWIESASLPFLQFMVILRGKAALMLMIVCCSIQLCKESTASREAAQAEFVWNRLCSRSLLAKSRATIVCLQYPCSRAGVAIDWWTAYDWSAKQLDQWTGVDRSAWLGCRITGILFPLLRNRYNFVSKWFGWQLCQSYPCGHSQGNLGIFEYSGKLNSLSRFYLQSIWCANQTKFSLASRWNPNCAIIMIFVCTWCESNRKCVPVCYLDFHFPTFCSVYRTSIAAFHGLCRHDEIMVINGALVQELDMMFVESVLQEELTLCLMIRFVSWIFVCFFFGNLTVDLLAHHVRRYQRKVKRWANRTLHNNSALVWTMRKILQWPMSLSNH